MRSFVIVFIILTFESAFSDSSVAVGNHQEKVISFSTMKLKNEQAYILSYDVLHQGRLVRAIPKELYDQGLKNLKKYKKSFSDEQLNSSLILCPDPVRFLNEGKLESLCATLSDKKTNREFTNWFKQQEGYAIGRF